MKVTFGLLILGAVALLGGGCASSHVASTKNNSDVQPSPLPTQSQVDLDKIRSVIRLSASDVRACYEKLAKAHPSAEGKAVVSFEINDQGHVQNASMKELDSSLVGVEDCLFSVFSKLNFENAPDHQLIEVSYPFCFSSGSGSDCFARFRKKKTE